MNSAPRAGFARRDLNEGEILPPESFAAPLEVRCFVVEGESGLACWLAYDLTCLYLEHADHIRAAVAAALGCGRDAVVAHCTHTHSVPDFFAAFPVETLAGQAVAAALEARARLRPFRLVEATADVGNRFSIMRRKFIPAIGTFTVWYGYRLEQGRADGAALIREQAERVFGPRPAVLSQFAHPIWFEDPVDPLVQALAFVGGDGKVMGSLIRFSAHPHTTSHVSPLRYHPDFPDFARKAMERQLGGVSLYLTGPCGDIVPKEEMAFRMPAAAERPPGAERIFGPSSWHKEAVPGDCLRVAKALGEDIAASVLDRLKREPEEPLAVRARTASLTVPLRENFARTAAAAASAREAEITRLLELQAAAGKGLVSLWELRAQADRVEQLGVEQLDIRALPPGALAAGRVTLEMGLLQLGDVILAGLPSEPGVGTSLRLRANTIGDRLWTVGLVNGWIGYLTGSADCLAGGYESNRTPMPPGGLAHFDEQAGKAVRELLR